MTETRSDRRRRLARERRRRERTRVPSLGVFVIRTDEGLRRRCDNLLADVGQKLREVVPYRDQLPDYRRRELIARLRERAELLHRALNQWADDLAIPVREVAPPRRRALP